MLSILLYEGRILRVVALVALQHRVGCMVALQHRVGCLKYLGWGEVGVEAVHGLSGGEIRLMLENHATQLTRENWNCGSLSPSKSCMRTCCILRMKGTETRCWQVASNTEE